MNQQAFTPGLYWLTRFSTVSGNRVGRRSVYLLGPVSGTRNRVFRVRMASGVVTVAARAALAKAVTP